MKIIEILGLVFGLFYIISMIKEKWYSWPFGILAVTLYGISCYHSKLFGESSLQVIYVMISFYGWFFWKKNNYDDVKVSKLKLNGYIFYLLFALSLTGLTYFILSKLDSELPILDSITNGFAITATLMAARKKIDNWIFWVPINILTVYMMWDREMPFYAILYMCYGLFAIVGYFQWKKNLAINNA